MHGHTILLALAGLLLISHVTQARQLVMTRKSSASALTDSDFDYFMLVRQWSGTFCSQHECPMVHRHGYRYTIHGLWPNYASGGWPQDCNANMRFDESKLSNILPELQEEWPSVFNEDESFWAHEWSKHGTCALDIFPSEYDFFKGTLDLHAKYDLQSVFLDAGITPSLTKSYRAYDLVQAVKKAYGVTPQLHCTNNRLSEIWMCVGKDLSVINCPSASSPLELSRESCSDIIIPPLPSAPSSQATISSNLRLGMAATRTAAQQQQQLFVPLTAATSTASSSSSQQAALPQQRMISLTSATSSAAAERGAVSVTREFVSEEDAVSITELGLPLQGEGGGLVVLSEGVVRTSVEQLLMMARLAALLSGQVEPVAVSVIEQQISPEEGVLVIGLDDPVGLDSNSGMLVLDDRASEDEEAGEEEAENRHHEHHHNNKHDSDQGEEDERHHHDSDDGADRQASDADADSDDHHHHHDSDKGGGEEHEGRHARKEGKADRKAEEKRSEKSEKAARKAEDKREKRDRDDEEEEEGVQRDVDRVDLDNDDAEDSGDEWSTAYMSQTKRTYVVKEAGVLPSVALRLEVARSGGSNTAARFASIVRVSPADVRVSTADDVTMEPADMQQTFGLLGVTAVLSAIGAVCMVLGAVLACSMAATRNVSADEDKACCAKGPYEPLPTVQSQAYSVSRPLLKHADSKAPLCN